MRRGQMTTRESGSFCSLSQLSAKLSNMLVGLVIIFAWTRLAAASDGSSARKMELKMEGDNFVLDGNNFRFVAGEIHYFRVARCSWHERMSRLKEAGLNAVSTSVEWAAHQPDSFDFFLWDGNANLTRFLEIASQLELYVILRAGPFIGADRDLGGLPGWILNDDQSGFQHLFNGEATSYRHYAESWLDHLLPKLKAHLLVNGGPVIAIQVDSDLGSNQSCNGGDWLLEIFRMHLGNEVLYITMDDNVYKNIFCGRINGALTGLRTDPRQFNETHETLFDTVRELAPEQPRVVELRTGITWSWGEDSPSFSADEVANTLDQLMRTGASVILYMFSGGTNFERPGHDGNLSMGMITSYDFDAPLDEAGTITDKFTMIKEVLEGYSALKVNGDGSLWTPNLQDHAVYEDVVFECVGSFLDPEVRDALVTRIAKAPDPMSFSAMGMSSGMVLYLTTIPGDTTTRSPVELRSHGIRDRGYVYLDDTLIGVLNYARRFALTTMFAPGQILQVLVESQGYSSRGFPTESKGIVDSVFLASKALENWTMYAFPMSDVSGLRDAVQKLKIRRPRRRGNVICRGTFVAPSDASLALDAFISVSELGKGQVFLNDRSLGKYWPKAGPQQTLYVPGCFVRPYPFSNHLIVVEMQRRLKDQEDQEQMKTPFLSPKQLLRAKTAGSSKTKNEASSSDFSYLFIICPILLARYDLMYS